MLHENKTLAGRYLQVKGIKSYGVYFVGSIDGKRLTESGRILLLHLTDTRNTGCTFRNAAMSTVESWGTLPLLFRHGKAEIRIHDNRNLKLHACGLNGKRLFEIPLKKENNGWSFVADNNRKQNAVFVYELSVR